MADRKKRLELTWIGKEDRPRLEPRILLEDTVLSHHAAKRVSDHDIFDNRLIHGDNLLALKALEQEFTGKIKCIYIDPPYNTGSAFAQYDDGLEHSLWLSLMRSRLELLWSLLRGDGSLWVSIDDSEMAYLRVMLDEICGRSSFVACNVWQKRYSRENREAIGDAHEYVLVYAKDPGEFKETRNKLPLGEKQLKVYKNSNNDPKGPWRAVSLSAQGFRANQMYEITSPSGKKHKPPAGSCWKVIEPKYKELLADGRIYFGKGGDAVPSRIQYLKDIEGIAPWTWWPHEDVGHTDEAKREMQSLFGKDDAFSTPKPERLLHQILYIASNAGDWVLDSFAGSGTTAAVSHKMGRRWIVVELGDHCHTHVLPRLKRVVDGEDPGGVTESCKWKGGGGFRYFNLAPSLLEKDKWGNWVVSRKYHPEMLAEAMCKIEGFHYAPDPEVFWIHGKSTETDFVYVTTQNLSRDQLRFISDQVGSERTLLICCAAFRAKKDDFSNLTVKKIPQAVLSRCEWGRDDYSLNVEELPPMQVIEQAKAEAGANGSDRTGGPKGKSGARRKKASPMQELPLFAGLDNGGKRK